MKARIFCVLSLSGIHCVFHQYMSKGNHCLAHDWFFYGKICGRQSYFPVRCQTVQTRVQNRYGSYVFTRFSKIGRAFHSSVTKRLQLYSEHCRYFVIRQNRIHQTRNVCVDCPPLDTFLCWHTQGPTDCSCNLQLSKAYTGTP